jgi:glycerol-3-phosphate acyltransferase PlsY
MISILYFILLVLAYLSGSIPFGYLLTKKTTGLNILEQGSGNIGSTNVGRVAGKRVALVVQLLDMLKGLIPVSLIYLSNKTEFFIFPEYFIYLLAFSTIIGHDFSVFLRFRGGKGVNTTLGATLLLAPAAVFCSVAAYYAVKWLSGYVSAGSMALAIVLPLTGAILHVENPLICYLFFSGCLILIRHIPNIKRLFSGKERR